MVPEVIIFSSCVVRVKGAVVGSQNLIVSIAELGRKNRPAARVKIQEGQMLPSVCGDTRQHERPVEKVK